MFTLPVGRPSAFLMKRIFGAALIGALFATSAGAMVLAQASTGAVLLASVNSAGTTGNANSGDFNGHMLSGDGTKVVFESMAGNLVAADSDTNSDIYVKDLATGVLTLVSRNTSGVKGNGSSEAPVISADGTKVAFHSRASNLDPADTDSTQDVYLKDLTTGPDAGLHERIWGQRDRLERIRKSFSGWKQSCLSIDGEACS